MQRIERTAMEAQYKSNTGWTGQPAGCLQHGSSGGDNHFLAFWQDCPTQNGLLDYKAQYGGPDGTNVEPSELMRHLTA